MILGGDCLYVKDMVIKHATTFEIKSADHGINVLL